LSVEGNLTSAHSIAWYNKGDALRHLGRFDEATAAFAQAQALDPELLPPKDTTTPLTAVPTTVKSYLPWSLAAGALLLVFCSGAFPR
jgi:tetratricopeptide (TPR) repeat protein